MKDKYHRYTLSNGQKVSALEVAKVVGITVSGARLRLKRSNTPDVIFAAPNKTTDYALTAKVYTLSNGYRATVRELRELTGIKENTLRQRLAISNDYNYVTRPLVFEDLNAKIYIFTDKSETTVRSFANAKGISHTAAYDLLESLNLESRHSRKQYLLDDGSYVTLESIIAETGVSHRTAKRRVQNSTDPQYVLAPLGTRHEKRYQLSDGSVITAREVASITGVTFEVAKQRLNKSIDRKEVLKPHYSKAKRLVQIKRYIDTDNGLLKVVEQISAKEIFRRNRMIT